MSWIRKSLALCVFGFLKEFRPSEQFLVDYLTGPLKNVTTTEVYQEIFPVGTYCYLATLLPVLLLTDLLSYKPVVILCGISGSCTYIALLLAKVARQVKIFEIFRSLFLSTEIAYFAYIYAEVDKEHYQAVSSYIRAAILLGRFASGIASQLTVSYKQLNYRELNYITLFGLVLATIWALGLPSVKQSIYHNQTTESISDEQTSLPKIKIAIVTSERSTGSGQKEIKNRSHKKFPSFTSRMKNSYRLLWKDFLLTYSNFYILKWSIWWTLATCGYMQGVTYIQLLWKDSLGEGDNNYNGAIEVGIAILGALAVLAIGKLRLNWPMIGEAMLSIFAVIQGCLLLMAAKTHHIWFSYIAYIGFDGIYQAMMTITSAEIAKNLSDYSYGLIFGINMLMALLLQSLLTIATISSQGFALAIRPQYTVCGSYFVALGTAFMIMAIYTLAKYYKSKKRFQLWKPSLTTP